MVKKSALTPVLSVVLAILILASGVLVAFRSNLFSKKKEKANETNYKVEFQGLNDVMTYLSNSATRLGDTFNGKVDAGYTTELGIELSDDVIYELGLKTNPGKVCITADSKLKGELAASNIGFKLNDGTILSVNTVIDGETVYLQIPELSKKYIKMDASELSNLTSELESLEDVTGVNTEELETLLNSFDEEKINKIIEKYTKIIEDNIPEGKKNGSEKGDINGIIYDYTKKEYTITSEVAYNMLKDILTEVGKDKDIKELYDYYIESAKKEMEEYNYDRYELDDYYPSFDDMIAETLEDLEDDYENINDDDEYLVKINVFYDGEKATGFSIVEDDQTITFVMSDAKEHFGFKFNVSEDDNVINCAFSAQGKDGKYTVKAVISEDNKDIFNINVETDVKVINEKTGAFTGTISLEMGVDGETAGVLITSNSTDNKEDFTFDVSFNDVKQVTVYMTSVKTNASDITVPSGDICDITDEKSIESYGADIDLEKFKENIKAALGEELYDLIEDEYFSSYNDDYDYNYESDFDSDWDGVYEDYNMSGDFSKLEDSIDDLYGDSASSRAA